MTAPVAKAGSSAEANNADQWSANVENPMFTSVSAFAHGLAFPCTGKAVNRGKGASATVRRDIRAVASQRILKDSRQNRQNLPREIGDPGKKTKKIETRWNKSGPHLF